MIDDIWREALQQGLWGMLFVGLLFFVLKTQEQREKQTIARHTLREERLISALDKAHANNQELANAFGRLNDDIKYIKTSIDELKQNKGC